VSGELLDARGVARWFAERVTWNMPGWSWEYWPKPPSGFWPEVVGALALTARTVDTYGEVPGEIKVQHVTPIRVPIPAEHMPHVFRNAVHQALCHEGDEWIRIDGVMMFDPHRDDPR